MVFKTTAFDRSATSPFIFKVLFYSVSGRFKTVIIYQLKPSLVALWSHFGRIISKLLYQVTHDVIYLINGFFMIRIKTQKLI